MADIVMVTGGLGAVGSYTCRKLVEAGKRPLIIDSGLDHHLIEDVKASCQIAAVSVLDLPALVALAEEYRPQAIVHLASFLGPEIDQNPLRAAEVNLGGTANILECARLSGIPRVVYASSKMIYAPVGRPYQHPVYELIPETHPREPAQLYGKLKRAAEDLAGHYANRFGLDVISLRFGTIFGPGKRGKHTGVSPIMALVEAAIAGQPIAGLSGGDQGDEFCYVGDYANGIRSAVDREARAGSFEAYHITSGEVLTLTDIARLLSELYPGWEAEIRPGLDYRNRGLGYYFRLNGEKAATQLGFRPEFDFRAAIRDYHRLGLQLGVLEMGGST